MSSNHWLQCCWLKSNSTILIFLHLSAFQYFYSSPDHHFHPGIKIPWFLQPFTMAWLGHASTQGHPCMSVSLKSIVNIHRWTRLLRRQMRTRRWPHFYWCRPTPIFLTAILQKPLTRSAPPDLLHRRRDWASSALTDWVSLTSCRGCIYPYWTSPCLDPCFHA